MPLPHARELAQAQDKAIHLLPTQNMPILLDEQISGTRYAVMLVRNSFQAVALDGKATRRNMIVFFQGCFSEEEVQQFAQASAQMWPIQDASSFFESKVGIQSFAWSDFSGDDFLLEYAKIFETFTVLDHLQFALHKNQLHRHLISHSLHCIKTCCHE